MFLLQFGINSARECHNCTWVRHRDYINIIIRTGLLKATPRWEWSHPFCSTGQEFKWTETISPAMTSLKENSPEDSVFEHIPLKNNSNTLAITVPPIYSLTATPLSHKPPNHLSHKCPTSMSLLFLAPHSFMCKLLPTRNDNVLAHAGAPILNSQTMTGSTAYVLGVQKVGMAHSAT